MILNANEYLNKFKCKFIPYSDVQPINIDQFMQPKELSQEPR